MPKSDIGASQPGSPRKKQRAVPVDEGGSYPRVEAENSRFAK